MAGDQISGKSIDAEHPAIEQPPCPVCCRPLARRLPEPFHFLIQSPWQIRHLAHDTHRDIRRHFVHDKSVHAFPSRLCTPIVRPNQPKEAGQ